MVKGKRQIFQIFIDPRHGIRIWFLPLCSLLTFISSWIAVYPPALVERWYARGAFPRISRLAGVFADVNPVAWLDIWIIAGLIVAVILVRKRRWAWILNIVAVLYLIFFWFWGLNYHRQPLASKLAVEGARMQRDAMEAFAEVAANELNRLYRENRSDDELRMREEADRRVRRVIEVIDGTDWQSARRIKVSWLANPWFRAAGIEGVFNPLGHEPVVYNSLLDVERPFVIAHELAHVRGYPDEGDANVIAAFATLMSPDPAFQYSGWLSLWFYLRTSEIEKLLDTGPRNDIERILERARREQIRSISDFQRSLLDIFLKANSVQEGVRSYSRVVLLVAATQPSWDRYR